MGVHEYGAIYQGMGNQVADAPLKSSWVRVLLYNLKLPEIHYVDHIGIKLTVIHLPLLTEYWDF